jgi:orotidine-5'-phosphate decarboxylase
MNFSDLLNAQVDKSNSLLCVGLDPDVNKLPEQFQNTPNQLFEFNKAIIDATHDLVCAFKPNSAYYEAHGPEGVMQLRDTISYIHETYPGIPVILDAKRADIGNTNDQYATFVFDYLGSDAVTLHPYLGREALEPFFARKEKGLIILCRTSNPGAGEFQDLMVDGKTMYSHVAKQVSQSWNIAGNCSLVVGATYPKELEEVRAIVGPDMPFLMPGVGAQGGDIKAAVEAGIGAKKRGLIINSARGVIFASSGADFAEAARKVATETRDEINKYR